MLEEPFRFYFLLPQSETELDFYKQKINIQVASRAVERLKISDVRILRNFKKILNPL